MSDPVWSNPATGGLHLAIDFGSQPRQPLHWLLNVDLRDSLWSPHKPFWEQRAPGAWEQMEACFTGQSPRGGIEAQQLIVQTALRKGGRYGQVVLNRGLARVHFWATWDRDRQDEPPNLTDTIRAAEFPALMEQIAQVEQGIIALQKRQRLP